MALDNEKHGPASLSDPQSICLPVCLFVCSSNHLFVCSSVRLLVCVRRCSSVRLFAFLSVRLFVYSSVFVCSSLCLFVCLSACLYSSVCLSILISIRLSVCLSVSLYVRLLSICMSVFRCVGTLVFRWNKIMWYNYGTLKIMWHAYSIFLIQVIYLSHIFYKFDGILWYFNIKVAQVPNVFSVVKYTPITISRKIEAYCSWSLSELLIKPLRSQYIIKLPIYYLIL